MSVVAGSIPLRRSLLVRLLAASVLIALCSIAATAWLAVQTTTRVIQQEQGQALSDDAKIYDELVGYAATHSSWAGVEPTLTRLATRTGRRITLTTKQRVPIAGLDSSAEPLPQNESAVIDALHTDPGLQPGSDTRIDPRVRGPYRLNVAGVLKQWTIAVKVIDCLNSNSGGGYQVTAVQDLSGYLSFRFDYSKLIRTVKPDFDGELAFPLVKCGARNLTAPSAAETRALEQLTTSLLTCLKARGQNPGPLARPLIGADGSLLVDRSQPTLSFPAGSMSQRCLEAAKRRQFRSYAAPPALVFVRSPVGVPPARFTFSGANLARIGGVAVGVLAITIAVTVLLGARLVRPLRALTLAAQHPNESHPRVPVSGRDEIGLLATALNTMTERRERADEQRTALVSDVAHELRTPLTNIRSWLEAVQDGLATPASDPALTGALLREALQLQAIIDDLQDLAVADAAGLRLSLEPVAVGELLAQVISAHGPQAESAGVRLTADATERLSVRADPVRLRQALGNLVANAIRYAPGGRISLVARNEGEEVVISVVDDGVGIAAEELPHVFDRFWRADRSRSRDSGGSGLGLAIVRQIAEAHAGAVTVTSIVGRGSSFVLRLPNPA